MALSPRPDPRVPALVVTTLLAALLVVGWPRPVTALAASVSSVASEARRPAPPTAVRAAGSTAEAGTAAGAGGAARPSPIAGPAGWRAPLDGPVTVLRPFEPPTTPYGPGHRGVDLAAQAGTTVRAAGPGVVSFAGVLAGRGVVAVTHGELRTTYEPLTVLVQVGQPVAAGTPLGLLDAGHAGCRPAVCLHWGLIRGRNYLSPLTLLLPAPPRLLPLVPVSPQTITATPPATTS
ncbi:murein hydrolase activator EnvC family protein [Pseudofrankia inefficax]|uniref:Peptidase M23 n=1 Tax=Pseudofrankia inefficax (strain DSM 45817 / CECT 9037 / DDB 130130 / EuI1c) TaxID=298654 RepID=E3J016_PSEI1|nr:M23 family metallopeptidase [Pseudofrankia inefficax]ADP79152.1 Peptidase M23 [Pseudofrankia inefficax]